MYDGAKAARSAAEDARALSAKLAAMEGADLAAIKEQLTVLAPPPPAGGRAGFAGRGAGPGGGRGAGRGAASGPLTLDAVSASMLAAAMAMQGAEMAPTARELAAVAEARRQSAAVMDRWKKLTRVDLAAINAKRKAAGQPVIIIAPPR
jgi:hypothetical protein